MKRLLLISVLAACFSTAWAFVNECSLLQEEESGFCGNPDVNDGQNLCYVLTSENDVKTLTIFRNPDAVGDDFGIAESFFNNWDFSALVIEDGVTSIGQDAFYFCENLTTVTLPDGLTSIGKSAFLDCRSLTTLNFPDGLTSIGQDAFYRCSSLTTVTFPDGLTSIGQGAFQNCSGLTTVTFPDGLVSIGQGAFYQCGSLATVTFPEGLASIGQNAFYRCSSLTTVTFPAGLSSIGESAFYNCPGLTTVTLPSSLTLIDKDAFLECSGITDIYCYAVPTQLTWDDNFCDDFMGRRSEKATRCHVYDEGDWSSFEGVNVTFVGDLPVVLEKNGDNSDLVAYPPTKAKDVTLADRFFIMDGSWNTLCLPFSLSSLDGTPLEGFTVMELDTQTDVDGHRTGIEGETLHLYFKEASGIEAGKPYLVKKTDMTEISATPIYSIISGTTGSTTQQSCDKLIDGRTDGNRWRTSISENDSAYCEFKADHFVYVTGYTLTTSNQNTIGDPMIWRLKAKLNEDDAWTVIDSRNAVVNSGDALPTARTAGKSYTVTNPATYRFFRFEVLQTGGNFMCLSELTLHATAVEFAIENPVFPAITIINSPAAKVTSADGKVTFAGSYKPIGGSSQLSLGTDNRLFHLADGKKMGALHAAFFTGEVNSAGDPVGDVNGDGSVDTSDAMLLVNKILTSTPGISDVTDLNSDDRVSISDVVTLVKKILNPDPSITVTTIVSNVDLFYDVSGSGAAR